MLYSENAAHSMNMSWTLGAALSLAINKDMFNGSKACGTCVMYRGVVRHVMAVPELHWACTSMAGVTIQGCCMQALAAGLG